MRKSPASTKGHTAHPVSFTGDELNHLSTMSWCSCSSSTKAINVLTSKRCRRLGNAVFFRLEFFDQFRGHNGTAALGKQGKTVELLVSLEAGLGY